MKKLVPLSKKRFALLDGLRGIAAISVLLFHFMEPFYNSDPLQIPLHHAYLAVDFFFLLSGFVIANAYDERQKTSSMLSFLKIRLIRLHPMVIVAVATGALCFWLDPFSETSDSVNVFYFIVVVLISLTLLPAPDLYKWGSTHSLDSPLWSLLQEYIASFLYAAFGKKITLKQLKILVILLGLLHFILAFFKDDFSGGWSYSTLWFAPVRMLFPFFTGVLLFRTGFIIRSKYAAFFCIALLVTAFVFPYSSLNSFFEAGFIVFVFPLIVALGAGFRNSTKVDKAFLFLGNISYPLYVIHYPFVILFSFWMQQQSYSISIYLCVALILMVALILVACLFYRFYDLPVRRWLQKL